MIRRYNKKIIGQDMKIIIKNTKKDGKNIPVLLPAVCSPKIK